MREQHADQHARAIQQRLRSILDPLYFSTMNVVTSYTSTAAAVVSLVIAMASFQAGASIVKQLIPAIGAPATTALRLGRRRRSEP